MSVKKAAHELNDARETLAHEANTELNKLLKDNGFGACTEAQFYRGLEKLTQILIDDGWV